jgi:hypothetical protein
MFMINYQFHARFIVTTSDIITLSKYLVALAYDIVFPCDLLVLFEDICDVKLWSFATA